MRPLRLALLLVLLAAMPAHAAIAVVQTASCEVQGGTSCTTGAITTTGGNLLVASTGYETFTSAFTSIADSKTNTWSSAIAEVLQDLSAIRMDYVANATGGATHTFTITGTGSWYAVLSVLEVSGAATASPLDQTKTNTEVSGTSHSTGNTATTAQANELLVGIGTSQDTTTLTTDTGAGWTERANVTGDVDSAATIVGSKIVSSAGTYAYTFTTGSDVRVAEGIATFKEASAAGARQRCIGCGSGSKVIE